MSLKSLKEKYQEFLEERDWDKLHTPKSVAMSISIESAELMELFQWMDNIDAGEIMDDEELVNDVREEVADIIIYSMSIAMQFDIDLEEAVKEKLAENDERFDQETVEELNRLWGDNTEKPVPQGADQ